MFRTSSLLNLPYSTIGFFLGILSIPRNMSMTSVMSTPTVIMRVRTLQWMVFFPQVRGITFGNTILLGPLEEQNDLEHELVHVEQFLKWPLIFPLLYWWELLRNGYQHNKYEVDAYTRAGNRYGIDT